MSEGRVDVRLGAKTMKRLLLAFGQGEADCLIGDCHARRIRRRTREPGYGWACQPHAKSGCGELGSGAHRLAVQRCAKEATA